jgi:hypothetical protein
MIPINFENFILRGCSLKNSAHIYGLVTYTGKKKNHYILKKKIINLSVKNLNSEIKILEKKKKKFL